MYARLKSNIPPGLVSLVILELAFLLLACYVGLALWTGLPAAGNTAGMEIVAGFIVLFTVYRSKK